MASVERERVDEINELLQMYFNQLQFICLFVCRN